LLRIYSLTTASHLSIVCTSPRPLLNTQALQTSLHVTMLQDLAAVFHKISEATRDNNVLTWMIEVVEQHSADVNKHRH